MSHVRSIKDIQKHGRWNVPKSVARHSKTGRLQRQLAKLTESHKKKARGLMKALGRDLCAALRRLKK